MHPDLGHIAHCLDLQEQDIAEAIGTRDGTRALLAHLESVSAPNTGVAKVLLVYARLGTMVCEWMDGDLTVELVRDNETTRIDAATELGGGLRERALPPFVFKAPLVEFARAIERVPHMVAPLALRAATQDRIVLSATEALRLTSIPPPSFEISAESLFMRVLAPNAPSEIVEEPREEPLPVVKPATTRQAPVTRQTTEVSSSDLDGGWDE